MSRLDAIQLKIPPGLFELVQAVASAGGHFTAAVLIGAADGAPIPFVKLAGGLIKLIQEQADASAKSDQYAQEAKERATATSSQVT